MQGRLSSGVFVQPEQRNGQMVHRGAPLDLCIEQYNYAPMLNDRLQVAPAILVNSPRSLGAAG